MQVILRNNNRLLVGNLMVADSFFARLKGLLGKTSLGADDGLLLRKCKGVHTLGMLFPIDVIFLNRENMVIEIIAALKPNRITAICADAESILELRAHKASETGLTRGDFLEIVQKTSRDGF